MDSGAGKVMWLRQAWAKLIAKLLSVADERESALAHALDQSMKLIAAEALADRLGVALAERLDGFGSRQDAEAALAKWRAARGGGKG